MVLCYLTSAVNYLGVRRADVQVAAYVVSSTDLAGTCRRACYLMSGTDLAGSGLRARYAVSGTDIAGTARRGARRA
eukprot:1413295-Rhodomonas_salina.1